MSRNIEFNITDASSGAAFAVKVLTRGEKAEFVGVEEGTLRIRLTAQSADGAEANEELINFLAEYLEADTSQFELVAGETKRTKLVSIEGIHPDVLNEKFGDGE